jgi:hypothetical protein
MRAHELRELKRLFDALRQAGNRQYKVQLGYVHELLEKTPRFRSIFDLLSSSTRDVDVDGWMQKMVFEARQTCHEWPSSETHKLRLLRRITEVCATSTQCDPTAVGRQLVYGDNLDDWAQAFTTHVVYPLVDYLQTRLGTDSEVLHHLERMRRQVEWFEQEKLYLEFSANTAHGEALYDRRVREFLSPKASTIHSHSLRPLQERRTWSRASTLTTPSSTTVRATAPRTCAEALAKPSDTLTTTERRPQGDLVVFNLSDDRLQLPSDEPVETRPPRLQVEGVTVFVVVVHAKPLPSASRDQHRQVREGQREDLVPTAEDSTGPPPSSMS